MWEIRKYNPETDRNLWNEFVDKSRNSTFLFKRSYMDYHAHRFQDCSMLAFRNGKLSAILPANLSGNILYSHQGLTYGGWILPTTGIDCYDLMELWFVWLEWCLENYINKIEYKPLPTVYQRQPSEEDRYLLFLCKADLIRTDVSSAIDIRYNPGINKLQKRHLSHIPSELQIYSISGAFNEKAVAEFHNMLTKCLQSRHDTLPVHSAEELILLMESFPNNISLWFAVIDEKLLAGVCLYETEVCNHSQYIATTEEGRKLNVLSAVFQTLIEYSKSKEKKFFDFGISNENNGRYLNAGLNRHKTSFGASGVIYDRWLIDVPSALISLQTSLRL